MDNPGTHTGTLYRLEKKKGKTEKTGRPWVAQTADARHIQIPPNGEIRADACSPGITYRDGGATADG